MPCLVVELDDSLGDGWNGAVYTLTNEEDETEATGTLTAGNNTGGSFATNEVCGLTSRCYTMVVSSGYYPSEISWAVTLHGAVQAKGGAPATVDGICI